MRDLKQTNRSSTCSELKGHCFVCFSFRLHVLDKAEFSASESTLNSSIVSCRIVNSKIYLEMTYGFLRATAYML